MIEGFIEYYANLLIVQYKSKPKAFETIKAYITQAVIDCLPIDVRDGFDLTTAIGAQLDILGKYIGKPRTFNGIIFGKEFFAFATAADPAPTENGFSEEGDLLSSDGEYGFLTIYEFQQSSFSLTDPDYRKLLTLVGIGNNSNHSGFQIDTRLFDIFGTSVISYDNQNMTMTYVFPAESSALLEVVREKDCLPKPMGVGIILVIATDDIEEMFGFRTAQNPDIPNGGFSVEGDLQDGEWLSSSNV